MKITGDWIASAKDVCGMLEAAGHQALFVGGCVRNALMGVPVNDIDISTDARPERVLELAEAAGLKAVPTGIDHGTVTVVQDGIPFEITTFRKDVETDGRRAVVAFSEDVESDARRRDFTINALYAQSDGTVIDTLGGLPDIEARRVRFIDDAEARIREDYLRILRFFRFHAHYGNVENGLDAEGLAACAALSDGIAKLSKERVGSEMLKLLAAQDPAPAVAAMRQTGVLAQVLPGAIDTALGPLVHVEQEMGLVPDSTRRLAVLNADAEDTALRLSKQDARRLSVLKEEASGVKGSAELGYLYGFDTAMDIVALRAAFLSAPPKDSEREDVLRGAEARFPVTAEDLMPAVTGKALGDRLKALEAKWIASGFSLSKDQLLG